MSTSGKILVTGATGFVGTHVVRELARTGHQVRCLVRDISDRSRLPESVEQVEGELHDKAAIGSALEGCRAIMHVAGKIRARSLEDFMNVNRDATATLVDVAKQSGVERFVLVSSQAAGGPEYRGRPRRADDPSEPVTDYGKSKLAGEMALRELAGPMWWCIVRPPAVYGPYDRAFFTFVQWVKYRFKLRLGDGRMRFAIIHGEDLAHALGLVLTMEGESGQTFYPTDGGEWTLFDLGRAVEKALGRRAIWLPIPLAVAPAIAAGIEVVAGLQGKVALLSRQKVAELSQPAWTCDSETFNKATGFKPRFDLMTGMAQTVAWYREKGWI